MAKVTIKVERVLKPEFLSDILITAFDGQYGGCWDWAEPVPNVEWPVLGGAVGNHMDEQWWLAVQVRVKTKDEPTGNPVFDREDGFVIDHEALGVGLSRIINSDYLNAGNGETAEGLRENITAAVFEQDAGMIDAYDAQAIVQAAAFGKVIFG